MEGEEEQVAKGPTRRLSQRPACGTEATLLSAMKQVPSDYKPNREPGC